MSEEDLSKGSGGIDQPEGLKGTAKDPEGSTAEINPTEVANKAADSTRGRGRNRICKHCRFSCTDVREFYHHQRTAHAEGQESGDHSPVTPTTRRTSLRIRRTPSAAGATSSEGTEAAQNASTPTLNGIVSKSATTSKRTGEEGTTCSETAGSISAQKAATKTAPGNCGNLAGSSSMISTNSAPTEGDPSVDLLHNMSNSFSDDENDLGEEGGRLVIDDSSSTSGGAVAATPTRCGNIQNRTYVCSVCDFTSTSAKSYLRHQRDEHSFDITIYECDICDYATKYKQKLPRHRKLHFSGTDFAFESGQGYSGSESADLGTTSPGAVGPSSSATTPEGVTAGADRGPRVAAMAGNSVADRSLPPVIVDDGEDEEMEEDASSPPPPEIMEIPDLIEKKKKTRQEVDPAKYFEVVDEIGMKYACSNCGNIYKWRKSLNKHWKEKHNGEVPDSSKYPVGMKSLVQSGNHTACNNRRIYHNALLEKITVPQEEIRTTNNDNNSMVSHGSSRSNTPQNFLNDSFNSLQHAGIDSDSSHLAQSFNSNMIGPFITPHASQPVFPSKQIANLTANLNGPIPSSTTASALDLSQRSSPMDETDSIHEPASSMQNEPLDFSVRKDESHDASTNSFVPIKVEPPEDRDDHARSMEVNSFEDDDDSMLSTPMSEEGQGHKTVLTCNICSFQAKTLVDYSSHMSLHLNKKAYKCASCQKHFPQIELLNSHFGDRHMELITSYKVRSDSQYKQQQKNPCKLTNDSEAIQKIPHGLQQTYHLLKMPLQSIPTISSQESASSDSKQLKCNMCDFVAKWPAELQKHAVSHSEDRPFVCIVCASTYKWKWDLVKHFDKAHSSLPNPYKRKDSSTPTSSLKDGPGSVTDSLNEIEENGEPLAKRRRRGSGSSLPDLSHYNETAGSYPQDDSSVAGILAITQAANQMVSRQPNFLDDGPVDYNSPPLLTPGGNPLDLANRSLDQSMGDEEENGATEPGCGDGPRPINEKTQKAVVSAIKNRQGGKTATITRGVTGNVPETSLPYKCTRCEYRARWPSEITQHMKNHSDEKPYCCPNCTYRSKWKWDVVKHMKRCGGGTIKDVIDTTQKKNRSAPPNATVMPEGNVTPTTPQPQAIPGSSVAYIVNTTAADGKIKPAIIVPRDIPAASSSPAATSAALASALASAQRTNSMSPSTNISSLTNAGSGSAQASSSKNSQQPLFRSLINQGQHHCLECPFIGNSPAELKRHMVLHSEDKPFTCGVCGYSTRWKCDLKKHIKGYSHYSPLNADILDSSDAGNSDKDSGTHKCRQCGFEASSSAALVTHTKEEHSRTGASPGKRTTSRFRCSACDFTSDDLGAFAQHRRSHGSQKSVSQTSPVPEDVEPVVVEDQDEARLKHPRKPVKKFTCSKCSFVCIKRQMMAAHEKEHELESTMVSCFYCNARFQNKNLLINHITDHPEFNPNEWETFFAEDDNSTEDVNNNNGSSKSKPALLEMGFLANTIDLTRAQNSPPQIISHIAQPAHQSHKNIRKFECEWCTAMFAHVATLYQHAQSVHPLELQEQEAKESSSPMTSTSSLKNQATLHSLAATQQTVQNLSSMPGVSKPVSLLVTNGNLPVGPFAGLKQNVVTAGRGPASSAGSVQFQANGQLSGLKNGGSRFLSAPSLASQAGEAKQLVVISGTTLNSYIKDVNANKMTDTPMNLTAAATAEDPSKQQLFQCTKCMYTAPSGPVYLRHIEMHGSNNHHKCWFCDFSVPRLNKLYHHMRNSHTAMWATNVSKQAEQELLSHIAKESLKYALEVDAEDIQDVVSPVPTSFADKQQQPKSEPQDPSSPKIFRKVVPSYQGVPIQPLLAEGVHMYKCAFCHFINSSAPAVGAHTKAMHEPLGKYQCYYCNYSDNKLKVVQQHEKIAHPNQLIYVYSVDLEDIMVTAEQGVLQDMQTLRKCLQANKSEPTDNGRALASLLSCMHCPYSTSSPSLLQQHLKQHNGNGKYRCGECDFSTDSSSFLVQHSSVHDYQSLGIPAAFTPITKSNASGSAVLDTASDIEAMDLSQEASAEVSSKESEEKDTSFVHTSTPNKGPRNVEAVNLSMGVDEQLQNEQTRKVQNRMKTNGRIRYKCVRCPFHTFCRNNIIKHRRQHLVTSRFRCRYCNYSATRAFLLKQHERFHLDDGEGGILLSSRPYQDIFLDPYNENAEMELPDDEGTTKENETYTHDLEGGDQEKDGPSLPSLPNGGSAIVKHEQVTGKTVDAEAKAIMEAENANAAGEPASSPMELGTTADRQFRSYKCKDCPYSSNSSHEFRKHCRFHGEENRYKCDYCSYSLDRLNLLSQHRKLHCDEHNFEPNPSVAKLLNHRAILKPLMSADPESVLVATIDDDPSLSPFTSATNKVQGPAESVDEYFTCQYCPYKTTEDKAFEIHCGMHNLKRKYICDYCDWSADRLSLLYRHRNVHSNEDGFDSTPLDNIFLNQEFAEDRPGEFEAKLLDLGTSKEASTLNCTPGGANFALSGSPPFKLSIVKKTYNCPDCPFTTGNKSSYDYHISLHDGAGKFRCEKCTYCSDRWSLLCQHKRIHQEQEGRDSSVDSSTSKRRLKCPKCPYHGPSKQLLDQHMEMHGAKPFLENSVDVPKAADNAKEPDSSDIQKSQGKSSKTVDLQAQGVNEVTALNDEEATTKGLQCQKCPFSTCSREELGRHLKQHSGSGTLVCPYCDFSCSAEDGLLSHVQVHFPSAPIDCETLRQMMASHRKDTSSAKSSITKSASSEPSQKRPEVTKVKVEALEPENSIPTPGKAPSKASAKDSLKTSEGAAQKTKVYVCQYCEREFEEKAHMIQHERQHIC